MEGIVISRYHVWIGIIVIVVVRVSRLLKRVVRGGTAVRWYRVIIAKGGGGGATGAEFTSAG